MRERLAGIQEGFTLVELMIVVAIIGILAAIAIPNFLAAHYRAKRAELPVIVSGIRHSEVGYDGLYDGYVEAEQWPEEPPDSKLDHWGQGNVGFDELGFVPDGQVRGVYAVNTVLGKATSDGGEFTVIGLSDLDGDEVYAKYTATHLRGVALITGNPVH